MGRIAKLDTAVVHRIAAGEVIQRPCNAIKEMIENSVDAGATLVQLTVQDGGLKQIQIQDNGHGILKEDLPLLCERFATSKLRKFEDLSCMKTFGFRGEALASISHVARVSVITKTKDSPCAFKVEYLNGCMVGDPTPTAGNQGTIIAVSDLFYNIPTRLKGLTSSPSEEYSHILKVAQRYAIQLAGRVGIACRKGGIGAGADVQTSTNLCPSSLDAIRNIYGANLAKHLIEIAPVKEESIDVELSGCVSVPTFHQKSLLFILFINGRLVESAHIKKAVTSLYAQLLPKGTSPFVYLNLEMLPQNVDVNVHPTKSQVFFLHEQQILEFVDKIIRTSIQASNLQLNTPSTPQLAQTTFTPQQRTSDDSQETPTSWAPAKKMYPFQMVHSDPKTRTMDLFLSKRTKIDADRPQLDPKASAAYPSVQDDAQIGAYQSQSDPKISEVYPNARVNLNVQSVNNPPAYEKSTLQSTQSTTLPTTTGEMRQAEDTLRTESLPDESTSEDPRELSSVKELVQEIMESRHERLTETLKNSVIVGVYDERRSLIQYQHKLLMIEHLRFAVEMLYQKSLLGFGFLDCWRLDTSISLDQVLESAEIDLIQQNSEMLLEYFSIHIMDGKIIGLPRLLEGLKAPSSELLSEFLERLVREVDWSDETSCFKDISQLIANTFASMVMQQPSQEEYIRHYLFPALKGSDLSKFGHIIGYDRTLVENGAIVELTSTHELYKIFERC